TAYDHYKAIIDHSYNTIVDYCVVNSTSIDDAKRDKYSKEGSVPVKVDRDKFKDTQVQILEADLINPEDPLAHHDTEKLAKLLISICKSKR
ncbi:MAG: 2-phospho-L-lactate transferase CofD family protein, partial [Eubacteriales bacterium]|nr:2-phospho-L-lactate transferase CofD family protein [Eubacteriales bacterium]